LLRIHANSDDYMIYWYNNRYCENEDAFNCECRIGCVKWSKLFFL